MQNCKIKICQKCGEEYRPTSRNQKYCEECILIAKKERDKQYAKQQYLEHPEYLKQYYQQHKDENSLSCKKWRLTHPEKAKECTLRHYNKRQRSLDFIPLNKWQEGYEAHHLDKVYVVYIPEEVHQSIRHSVLKDKNMDIINAIAFNYM